MVDVKPKVLSCLFLPNVLCSFRKVEQFAVLDRCSKCSHYHRFWREMEEAEDKFWEEEERLRREELHG